MRGLATGTGAYRSLERDLGDYRLVVNLSEYDPEKPLVPSSVHVQLNRSDRGLQLAFDTAMGRYRRAARVEATGDACAGDCLSQCRDSLEVIGQVRSGQRPGGTELHFLVAPERAEMEDFAAFVEGHPALVAGKEDILAIGTLEADHITGPMMEDWVRRRILNGLRNGGRIALTYCLQRCPGSGAEGQAATPAACSLR